MLFLLSYDYTTLKRTAPFLIFLFVLLFIPWISYAQENGGSSVMQNLTARYNILFNARELIKTYESDLQTEYKYTYNRMIPVFVEPDPQTAESKAKKLTDAISKANVIANEKAKSNYVDDAYLLIGIANHLKADFFNAVEFFEYIYQNYPKSKEIRQAALVWKGRSLMQLKRFNEAQASLDTAIKYVKNSKKMTAETFAARAQLHIYAKEFEDASSLLAKAIKASKNKKQKLYWTYLSGQLEVMNQHPEVAYKRYTAIVKSNAPFEMAFNANLNRIAIEEEQVGEKLDKEAKLRALLKDEKNKELTDQIYFQIAQNFAAKQAFEKAIENYNIAIRQSSRNMEQRGLSYWALSTLYFKQADYVQSKKYLDSALSALPPSYPDYETIRKKSQNLDLIAKNLVIIAEEDTLQYLAGLSEKDREISINQLIEQKIKKTQIKQPAAVNGSTGFALDQNQTSSASGGKFYFNNSAALSQGFSDFKRKWGNRKLEDDWRRSQKTTAELSSAAQTQTTATDTQNQQETGSNATDLSEELRNDYLFRLPNNPDKLAASNLRIADAYFELGNYYREVFNDQTEAINAFEKLLQRFPEYRNRAAVYYNLYRLYAETDSSKSESYKQKIVTEHPMSVFAKVIIDPEFSQKQDEKDLALGRSYNQIFDEFAKKNYKAVLACIREFEAEFGKNRLSAQIAYLKAISAGHQQSLKPFEDSLQSIVNGFPDDKLITPLIKQYLDFIEKNRKQLSLRPVVLVDKNPDNLIWAHEIESILLESKSTTVKTTAEPIKKSEITTEAPKKQLNENNSVFNLADTEHYYVVVNVTDPSVNLSSSRFGIGQFNRANFPDGGIKHQLKDLNENQLILIGEFGSRNSAKEYETNILPLMGEIMKIPANQYTLFIITKANLDKLTTTELLDQYLIFYKENYQ